MIRIRWGSCNVSAAEWKSCSDSSEDVGSEDDVSDSEDIGQLLKEEDEQTDNTIDVKAEAGAPRWSCSYRKATTPQNLRRSLLGDNVYRHIAGPADQPLWQLRDLSLPNSIWPSASSKQGLPRNLSPAAFTSRNLA